jgi:hypothetical protein
MSLEWEQIVVDARQPVALGRWWNEALRWVIVNDDPGEFEIRPQADRLPGLIFEPVDDRKQIKNRAMSSACSVLVERHREPAPQVRQCWRRGTVER